MTVEGKRRFANRVFRLDELDEGEYICLNDRWFARPPMSWAAQEIDGVTEYKNGTITASTPIGVGRTWTLSMGQWCAVSEKSEKFRKIPTNLLATPTTLC